MVCVPVEDAAGNVVRDHHGNPILTWVERTKSLTPSPKAADQEKLAVSGPLGLKISYESKSKG